MVIDALVKPRSVFYLICLLDIYIYIRLGVFWHCIPLVSCTDLYLLMSHGQGDLEQHYAVELVREFVIYTCSRWQNM